MRNAIAIIVSRLDTMVPLSVFAAIGGRAVYVMPALDAQQVDEQQAQCTITMNLVRRQLAARGFATRLHQHHMVLVWRA